MNDKFAFLTSIRFWKLFLTGIVTGLGTYSQTNNVMLAISAGVGVWLGGSVVVGTVDRASEQKVIAAEVTSGTKIVTN